MQPFRKERQNKPYKCSHCPKSFKSSNGLKYHSEKVHVNEDIKMETGNTEVKPRGMQSKSRTIPAALNLCPEVNLLTEFALIATSPQSPLVREVNGENVDVRRSEGDSPPPQLVDPKQVDFQPSEWRCVSQTTPDSPTQTLLQAVPAAKWRCFMAGTRVKFPDEDEWTWRTMDDIEMKEISEDLFQDGLRVVDYERISTKYYENSEDRENSASRMNLAQVETSEVVRHKQQLFYIEDGVISVQQAQWNRASTPL